MTTALQLAVHRAGRGSTGAAVPFFDQERVIGILDSAGDKGLDLGDRIVLDQVLTMALSCALLNEGLGLQA